MVGVVVVVEGVVNVNEVDVLMLQFLLCVGLLVVGCIVEYCEVNGLFKLKEDFFFVCGIGEVMFEFFEFYVVVEGLLILIEKVCLCVIDDE